MKCSICNEKIEGFGHNAQPINDGMCCDDCNNLVLVERIDDIINKGDVKWQCKKYSIE